MGKCLHPAVRQDITTFKALMTRVEPAMVEAMLEDNKQAMPVALAEATANRRTGR